MGRHPRAGRRRHARGRDARLPALFAHRRGHLGELPRPGRGAAARRRHRRRAPGRARAAACSPSTCCSSGSTARPSRPSCWPSFPRICAPTICWSTARTICASGRSPQRRARLEAVHRAPGRPPRRSLAAGPVQDLGRAGRRPRRPGAAGAAPTPKRSKASCSSGAMRLMCPAGRRACGGNGSAIRSSSTPC